MKQPHWWFEGASVAQIKAYFHDYDRPVKRVEVRVDGGGWRARVVRWVLERLPVPLVFDFCDAAGHLGTVNDSHHCPPSCPNGG